jgi:N-acetylmuramoyl-L-alanine amidase
MDRARKNAACWFLLALATLLLAACAPPPVRSHLAQWLPSPNHNDRHPVLIVLHATEQDSVQQSLLTLRTGNAGGKVSAHYLIGRDGKIYQLVSENQRAWHAGGGSWGTIPDVNSASIGIELDNNGHDPFAGAQIQALLRLLDDVCTRQRIPRRQVIAHADLAPARKVDPGALFPWQQLAAAGFGPWPSTLTEPPAHFDALAALQMLGYPMADPAAAIRAFHLRFRGQAGLPAVLDSDDARILHALQPGPRLPASPEALTR